MTILNVADIQARLLTIFPEGTEQRTYLTREMAAKTVFTALYANAIEGLDRWIRPNQVCRMTDAQTLLLDDGAREAWYVRSGKNGYVPTVGAPWFADTTPKHFCWTTGQERRGMCGQGRMVTFQR
jgi:hypothetical protein